MTRHIFIDNSNIFGGAFRLKDIREPEVAWPALRLSLENLFRLLEGEDDIGVRAFAASGTKTAEAIWDRARNNGYDTYLLTRIELQNGKQIEQGVDEIIHLAMVNAVIDYEGNQTLVLASGDGRESNFGTSFVGQVERALRKDWKAEIWSWSPTMTGKYENLKNEFGDKIQLKCLDDYYLALTWVKSGRFTHDDGTPVEMAGRQSERLA